MDNTKPQFLSVLFTSIFFREDRISIFANAVTSYALQGVTFLLTMNYFFQKLNRAKNKASTKAMHYLENQLLTGQALGKCFQVMKSA